MLGQARQRQDEEQPGDDVGTLDQGERKCHRVSPSLEHLEHSLRHGEATEDVDAGHKDPDEGEARDPQLCAQTHLQQAPTTMMPLIALVTDISGVCRAWCTLPMT
jgi:hypothetical protein